MTSVSESIERKLNMNQPEAGGRLLSPDERQSLLDFVRFGLGDGRLRSWEERFLIDRHQELYGKAVWLTDKQRAKVQEIKDKLQYDRQDVPLQPIDPDGVEDNDDPDGWPVVRDDAGDLSEDEEQVEYLAEA
jgi:hypothetical protein